MTPERRLTLADPATLKACCAATYESDLVALVLGETYHPGGLELTRRLGRALKLRAGDRVLDVACGSGVTACFLAEEFAADVDGVDLGPATVQRARARAEQQRLGRLVRFHVGDAERLPFEDATFDAVVCECAFCTFPSKEQAAAELARVLRPGGRLGLTDVTVDPARLDPGLASLAGYVACLADARPSAEYETLLAAAGLHTTVSEAHDEALSRMIEQIEARLRALSLLGLPGVDLDTGAILHYTAMAAQAVADRVCGYCLIVAEKA